VLSLFGLLYLSIFVLVVGAFDGSSLDLFKAFVLIEIILVVEVLDDSEAIFPTGVSSDLAGFARVLELVSSSLFLQELEVAEFFVLFGLSSSQLAFKFGLLHLDLVPSLFSEASLFLGVLDVFGYFSDLVADLFNGILDFSLLFFEFLLFFVELIGVLLDLFGLLQLLSPPIFLLLSFGQFCSFTFLCGSSFSFLSLGCSLFELQLKFFILLQLFLDFFVDFLFFIGQRMLGLGDFDLGFQKLFLLLVEFFQIGCLLLLLEFPFFLGKSMYSQLVTIFIIDVVLDIKVSMLVVVCILVDVFALTIFSLYVLTTSAGGSFFICVDID